jgi:hypothetical protein
VRRLFAAVVGVGFVVAAWSWSNFVEALGRPKGHGWLDGE